MQAVVGGVHAVAEHEAVLGQLVRDGAHGGPYALVLRREEAHQRHQEHRRVEGVRLVVLAEHAAVVHRLRADVLLDLVGRRLPARRLLQVLAQLGQPRPAVGGHPAHELGGGEVLGVPAHLPDAPVGLAPVGQRRLHLLADDRPDPLRERVARLRVEVDRVEVGAPHVVLVLVVGGVADPHRPRALVAGQPVERALVELGLAPDPVHDLELALLGLGHVGDEVEEVVRLPVEAEGVEAPEHEGGVADPGVAVVPVALPAGRLGQRGGGRGHHRSGGRVGEALEGERAALEVGAPRVVRELAVVQPVLPVVGRPHQLLVGVLVVRGRRVLGPGERGEQRLALLHQGAGGGARALEAHPHVGGELQPEVAARRRWPPPRCSRARRTPRWPCGARSRTPARSPGGPAPRRSRSAPAAAARGRRRSRWASGGGCGSGP